MAFFFRFPARHPQAGSRPVWLLACASLVGCAHPAERALQGHWNGVGVENFDREELAAATGWARGTSFEFSGKRLTVTVPASQPRRGAYELASIKDQEVTLAVVDAQGDRSTLELTVDDAESLRWKLGDGRSMVLKKLP